MTSADEKKTNSVNLILGLLIVGVIIAIGILASVPPVDRDALTHHLYVPKLYLQHGGMYEIPNVVFSYYPMNLDLLYLIPMYFGNDIIPKFIHFAFALVTAGLIFRYLCRRIDKQHALLGSLFFLSIPVIIRLSSTVYVDLGIICFFFASILYLFHWIENTFKIKYLIFSAVFCGLALGTKYNGLVGLFLLGLFVPFVYARYHAGEKSYATRAIGYSLAYVGVTLIVFSPWMVRNVIWTGNPVYPLYNNVFNPQSASETIRGAEASADSSQQQRQRWSHIDTRRIVYGESWWEIALVPVRVFFNGQDDTPKYFDGKTSPFLLLLTPLAFLGLKNRTRQEKTEMLILLFFSVLFLLYACVQASIRIRYFSPIIPPMVVLSMYGLANLRAVLLEKLRLSAGIQTTVLVAAVVTMLGLNASYLVTRFHMDQPVAYVAGKITRDDYIQTYRPDYASFQYANRNLAQDARILGLYLGNRGYYSDVDISFRIQTLQEAAAVAVSAGDVLETLRKKQFTHMLVNYQLFNYSVQFFSLHEKQIIKDFFENYAVAEFSKDGFGLFRLVV